MGNHEGEGRKAAYDMILVFSSLGKRRPRIDACFSSVWLDIYSAKGS